MVKTVYVIVVKVFDGGDGEDADERHGCGDGRQRRDGRDELQHQKAGEVKIGQPVELLEQIQRQERHQRVLGRLDVIVLSTQFNSIQVHSSSFKFIQVHSSSFKFISSCSISLRYLL